MAFLGLRAAQAAQTAAYVTVDESERGGHEATEVGYGQQGQRDAHDRVEHGHHATPVCFRCDVAVPWKIKYLKLYTE